MKIGDQRERTLKDLMIRRVLKDNKVPGTSMGTRTADNPRPGAGSAAEFLGESQAGLCERPGACLDQGACIGRISQKEKENRGTQRIVTELSPIALASGAPPPSAPGL